MQNEWLNSCANVDNSKDVKKFTNPLKYKCDALCVFQYILKNAYATFE
jgi:hypothetical protein